VLQSKLVETTLKIPQEVIWVGHTFPNPGNNSQQRRDYCPNSGFMPWSL